MGTKITDANHLTPMILSSNTLELAMWPTHHGQTIKQNSSTCPKLKRPSQETTINTLAFKDVDKKI
jgi:hypothetical protein